MLYFANPCANEVVIQAMLEHEIGYIDNPRQGEIRPKGVLWCADNGCYGQGWPGEDRWLQWLGRNRGDAASCAFATAPDVVADAAATLERSLPMLPLVRALGYRAALVAQDGLERLVVPWDDFDVLFLGGTTTWKLGPQAAAMVTQARARGKPVHMGRVNSFRRYACARSLGCTSVDGTFLRFGPEINLGQLRAWSQGLSPKVTGYRRVRRHQWR